jgi:hypothetical protein
MVIYTQITKPESLPEDAMWYPGLQTETIKHRKAWKQPLLVTHIESVKHYEYDFTDLLNEKVYCIGPKTYDRLVDMGFTKIEMHGLVASDIKINSHPLTPCTWLHGDKFAKDFGKSAGVTAIQTYKSSLHESSLQNIITMQNNYHYRNASLYVYSPQVLEALQNGCTWKLFHTESCTPNPDKWSAIKSFYPGSEFD